MLKNAVLDAKIHGNFANIWQNSDKILTASKVARVAAKDALAAGDLAGVAAAASALRSGIAIENQIEI